MDGEKMRKATKALYATFLLVLCLVLPSVSLVRAQSVMEGKLTGSVADDRGETLPGATIEITGPAIMGKRSAMSSAKGSFVFLNVPPGTLRLTASLPGFKTYVQENIILGAGSTVEINVVLQIGAIEEQVTVTAASPIVDVKTSTVDSRLEKDMLAKLPTSRDAFYDLSLTTPGIFDHGGNAGWLPSPTAYGSATNENVFLINGVDATNARGGTFGANVRVNYNTVEEVRVIALGSKAEYGSFSGVAIDVLTKSGSNAFHGSAAVYAEPVKWRKSNQPSAGTNKYGTDWLWVDPNLILYSGAPEENWEGNITVGGPIIKDRLWFFGGFDYLYRAATPPRWDLLTENWGRYGDIKISAEPLKSHRAWVSYHYENNDGTGWSWGSQPEWDTTASYNVGTINHTLSSQWQWLPTSQTILTAKYLGYWTDATPTLPADAPVNPLYVNWWKWAQYGINGAFANLEAFDSLHQTIQADVSHYAEDFLGEHDIKFGIQFTKGRSNTLSGYFQNYINCLYPYRWTQYVRYMQSWYGDTGLLFNNLQYFTNAFQTVRTGDSLGIFFDDQWSPTKRLTVNLGFRFDRLTAKYGEGDIYELFSKPSDINDPTVLRQRQGTGNIFDFKTIAPRVGLTYSLTGDGKTVARASYGRYYMPLMTDYLGRGGPDMPGLTTVFQLYSVPWEIADANGDGYIDADETREAARHVRGSPVLYEETYPPVDYSWTLNVDPELKDQSMDQFTLNLEREVISDFSVSATFIYKHSADIFAHVPINRQTGQDWEYDRVPFSTSSGQSVMLYSIKWEDYNGDGAINNDDVLWIAWNNDYRVVNMGEFDGRKPKRDYLGLQLVLNKRYSHRWQALASFLYSDSSGMANRASDQNVLGPLFADNVWMSSLNQTINNLEGPLPYTPKLEIKISGSYTVPGIELDLGARFRMHSGRPVWRMEAIPVYNIYSPDNPPGSVIDVGSGIIVGQDPNEPNYLPAQTILDLRAEKLFKLGRSGSFGIILDIFNVFNSDTPNAIDNLWNWGKVGSIIEPRTFRFSLMYQF
jgi:Carboxypeptidase regulatory-like domain